MATAEPQYAVIAGSGFQSFGVIAAGQHPGEIAIPGQIIDYTFGRHHSIYDGESASLNHIEFTEPFAGRLRADLRAAAE